MLLILGAISQTSEPYLERGSIKMGQRKATYWSMKINKELHFNKALRVADIYSYPAEIPTLSMYNTRPEVRGVHEGGA